MNQKLANAIQLGFNQIKKEIRGIQRRLDRLERHVENSTKDIDKILEQRKAAQKNNSNATP